MTTTTAEFVSSSLVTWVKSLMKDEEDNITQYKSLCDGIFLHSVWQQINAEASALNVVKKAEETGSRIKNLYSLLSHIKSFYENYLGQVLVLRLPDVIKIATECNDENADCEDMKILLLLLLGSAVQCEKKEHFIEKIKQLDISIQHSIVECLQQITDNPNAVWLNSDWSEISNFESEEEQERMYSTLVENVNRLAKERDCMLQRLIDLTLELDNLRQSFSQKSTNMSSVTSPSPISSSSSLTCISSPIIVNGVNEQISQLLTELAEVKSKLRTVQSELEEKNEIVIELRETLQQYKESCNKLRQDNLELIQDARSAKAFRDEIDVLNERVRKVDRLESEVQRCRDKMNELEFYKSRVEEIREDNRILSETKVMLEEQLERSRKRAERLPDLEGEILQLRAQANEMIGQKDLERDRIEAMAEELTKLQIDKKAAVEELAQVQGELRLLRSQMNNSLMQQNGEGNLLEQINNDTNKRVLKLELENQKLQSFVENMKNSKSFISNSSIYDNKYHCISRRLSLDSLPNCDGDDMLSPEGMSETSDSPFVSLSAELNARLEKMETENARLRSNVEKLRETELKISDLMSRKSESEKQIQDLKQKVDSEEARSEKLEKNNSQLSTENQRLQRQIDNHQKRLEQVQQEASALESENNKLIKLAETLKSTLKRLHEMEREMTNLEAENHRLEQEKKSGEKEISRLKEAIDVKDNSIYEYARKISTLEFDNKQLKKEIEKTLQNASKAKDLEKFNKPPTDLCITRNKEERMKFFQEFYQNKNLERSSAPLSDDSAGEAIYGKIWEAVTPTKADAVALQSSHGNLQLCHNNERDLSPTDSVKKTDLPAQQTENAQSSLSPPPRTPTTSIESKLTVNVIARPVRPYPDAPLTKAMGSFNENHISRGGQSHFLRGGFKSSSINYGSPIKQINDHQRSLHLFHHHTLHVHSASPSLHSDSSLTPIDDPESDRVLSPNANSQKNSTSVLNDNDTVNGNATNSVCLLKESVTKHN